MKLYYIIAQIPALTPSINTSVWQRFTLWASSGTATTSTLTQMVSIRVVSIRSACVSYVTGCFWELATSLSSLSFLKHLSRITKNITNAESTLSCICSHWLNILAEGIGNILYWQRVVHSCCAIIYIVHSLMYHHASQAENLKSVLFSNWASLLVYCALPCLVQSKNTSQLSQVWT